MGRCRLHKLPRGHESNPVTISKEGGLSMQRLGRPALMLALALSFLSAIGCNAEAADKVKVGLLRIPQALFVGMEKGFFAAQGIEAEAVFFRSGAEVVPSLSRGQIDAASTS